MVRCSASPSFETTLCLTRQNWVLECLARQLGLAAISTGLLSAVLRVLLTCQKGGQQVGGMANVVSHGPPATHSSVMLATVLCTIPHSCRRWVITNRTLTETPIQ